MRISTLLEWGAIFGIFLVAILAVQNIGLILPSSGSGGSGFTLDSLSASPACMVPENGGFFQEPLSGSRPITRQVDEWTFSISPQFRYTIIGRIVGKDTYSGGPENTLLPMDLTIANGDIIRPEIFRYFTFQKTPRHYLYSYYAPAGSPRISQQYAVEHTSNNHLIFANESLHQAAESLKVGDSVSIQGYLVTISGQTRDKRGTYYHGTSTIRTDQGEGACETVYVESLERLNC